MKRHIEISIIMLFVMFFNSACVSVASSQPPWSVSAKVVDKKPLHINFGLHGILSNGVSNIRYLVEDKEGRKSVVISPYDFFKINQCVSLWRSSNQGSNGATYPRISLAQSNCKPLDVEPADIGKYTYLNVNAAVAEDMFQMANFVLDTWLDTSEASLVSSRGAPNSSYSTDDGRKFITYSKRWIFDNGYEAYSNQCDRTFEIRKGYVFDYNWQGDCN